MRALTTALLVALLTGYGLGSAMAEPPEPDGHRVEVPAHDLALVLPEDWSWEIRTGEPDDPASAGLFAQSPSVDARCHARALSGPTWDDPQDGVAELTAMATLGWRGTPVEPIPVLLPAGPGIRIDEEITDATANDYWPEPPRPWSTDPLVYAERTTYQVIATDGTHMAQLSCQRPPDTGPDDRWLFIAETLEFLPAEPPSAEAGRGPAPIRRL